MTGASSWRFSDAPCMILSDQLEDKDRLRLPDTMCPQVHLTTTPILVVKHNRVRRGEVDVQPTRTHAQEKEPWHAWPITDLLEMIHLRTTLCSNGPHREFSVRSTKRCCADEKERQGKVTQTWFLNASSAPNSATESRSQCCPQPLRTWAYPTCLLVLLNLVCDPEMFRKVVDRWTRLHGMRARSGPQKKL
ncbi:hypothetical protein BJV74DRAFT_868408 [Russula compacta]|nr:hypothetical protein BJV74DRAFT_868408 [Russula compacta]